MKSYEDFWENLKGVKNEDLKNFDCYLLSKNRSSTIFPVFKASESKVYLEFLTYWLKKHGNYVVIKFSLRCIRGHILNYDYMSVTNYKSVSYDVDRFFKNEENGFCGSVEVEVFSKSIPVYTFPAISLHFDHPHSSSVIHSCVRTYNENERPNDYAICFPQTGFDISLSTIDKNYICFFGGYQKTYKINLILEESNLTKDVSIQLDNQISGKMHLLYIEDLFSEIDLKKFTKPKVTIIHNLNDVFPRFYVGVISGGNIPTLTHTFFDTSEAILKANNVNPLKSRVDNKTHEINYDSSFIIPIFPTDMFKTSLKSYSQNLTFFGRTDLIIYSEEGQMLSSRSLKVKELEALCQMSEFDVSNELISPKILGINNYSMFFGFVDKKIPFPKRFKLGLNIKKRDSYLGTNICFTSFAFYENSMNKPMSQKWFPLGGRNNFIASVHNTDLLINKSSEAVEFSFEFVNSCGVTLERRTMLKSNASIYFDIELDSELHSFFDNKVGWCLVKAKTYLVDAYYFSSKGRQIGGDHAY